MNYNFSVIGGDKRNVYASNYLKSLGHNVKNYGFDKCDIPNDTTLQDTIKTSDFIICPIPFSRDNIFLNTPLSSKKILINDLLSLSNNTIPIFTGALNSFFDNKNLIDIYKTKNVTKSSTIATAEGAIKIAIENTDFSLFNSNILIIGYGNIGSHLAKLLKTFGANVSIATRSDDSIKKAMNNGFETFKTTELKNTLSNKNIIFNTAPFIQITKDNMSEINKDCLYIELASSPFGIDYEESKNQNIKVIYGMSLPGLISPKTVATTLVDEILENIKELK